MILLQILLKIILDIGASSFSKMPLQSAEERLQSFKARQQSNGLYPLAQSMELRFSELIEQTN